MGLFDAIAKGLESAASTIETAAMTAIGTGQALVEEAGEQLGLVKKEELEKRLQREARISPETARKVTKTLEKPVKIGKTAIATAESVIEEGAEKIGLEEKEKFEKRLRERGVSRKEAKKITKTAKGLVKKIKKGTEAVGETAEAVRKGLTSETFWYGPEEVRKHAVYGTMLPATPEQAQEYAEAPLKVERELKGTPLEKTASGLMSAGAGALTYPYELSTWVTGAEKPIKGIPYTPEELKKLKSELKGELYTSKSELRKALSEKGLERGKYWIIKLDGKEYYSLQNPKDIEAYQKLRSGIKEKYEPYQTVAFGAGEFATGSLIGSYVTGPVLGATTEAVSGSSYVAGLSGEASQILAKGREIAPTATRIVSGISGAIQPITATSVLAGTGALEAKSVKEMREAGMSWPEIWEKKAGTWGMLYGTFSGFPRGQQWLKNLRARLWAEGGPTVPYEEEFPVYEGKPTKGKFKAATRKYEDIWGKGEVPKGRYRVFHTTQYPKQTIAEALSSGAQPATKTELRYILQTADDLGLTTRKLTQSQIDDIISNATKVGTTSGGEPLYNLTPKQIDDILTEGAWSQYIVRAGEYEYPGEWFAPRPSTLRLRPGTQSLYESLRERGVWDTIKNLSITSGRRGRAITTTTELGGEIPYAPSYGGRPWWTRSSAEWLFKRTGTGKMYFPRGISTGTEQEVVKPLTSPFEFTGRRALLRGRGGTLYPLSEVEYSGVKSAGRGVETLAGEGSTTQRLLSTTITRGETRAVVPPLPSYTILGGREEVPPPSEYSISSRVLSGSSISESVLSESVLPSEISEVSRPSEVSKVTRPSEISRAGSVTPSLIGGYASVYEEPSYKVTSPAPEYTSPFYEGPSTTEYLEYIYPSTTTPSTPLPRPKARGKPRRARRKERRVRVYRERPWPVEMLPIFPKRRPTKKKQKPRGSDVFGGPSLTESLKRKPKKTKKKKPKREKPRGSVFGGRPITEGLI